jgi:hypothetical protein
MKIKRGIRASVKNNESEEVTSLKTRKKEDEDKALRESRHQTRKSAFDFSA